MANFDLPHWNIWIDGWHTPPPVGTPPRDVDFVVHGVWVQARRSSVYSTSIPGTAADGTAPTYLLLPMGVRLYTAAETWHSGKITWLRPQGYPTTGALIAIDQVVVGVGFPNEHVQCRCAVVGYWGWELPALYAP